MQLLGYGQGITVIIPSDISPDMFGTRSCSLLLINFVQACHNIKTNDVGCFTVL